MGELFRAENVQSFDAQHEFHGSNVKPSGRLSSSRTSPCGSFMRETPARVKARQMTAML